MSKKKRQHVAKSGPLVIDSRLVWQTRKPRYNGFACGYGKHGDAKYNRAKAKNAWRKDFGTKGSQEGPFFLMRVACPLFAFYFGLHAVAVLSNVAEPSSFASLSA